jgi:DNA-binding NarL/FixJ family response regulator
VKVILADDHSLVRDSLRQYVMTLADSIEVCEAASLPEVLTFAHGQGRIDLILLDLQMPGMTGMNSVAEVRTAFPAAKIVIISATTDSQVIGAALRVGVNGYIPKTMHGKSLVTALRLVLDGEQYVPAELLNAASAQPPSAFGAHPGDATETLSRLSPREAMVMRLLIAGKSNKEIGRELDLQEVTVKVHLRNIYRKIRATNRTEAVRIMLSQEGIQQWLQSPPPVADGKQSG